MKWSETEIYWKDSWNHFRETYFWQVWAIWNHCASASTTTNSISCDAKKENLACTIRHRGCNVDLETIAWIESGLNRLTNDSELMTNVLLKWNTFLKQHVMQNLSQVSFHEGFFFNSVLPNVWKENMYLMGNEVILNLISF